MDIKSLISYNVNKNHNVEVIFKKTKIVDEKDKHITDTKKIDEEDKSED